MNKLIILLQVDRVNLKRLLTGLHFKVKVCLNLKYQELDQVRIVIQIYKLKHVLLIWIKYIQAFSNLLLSINQELLQFSKDPQHANADMMILVILSHGKDGKIITSSGREYQIESIYERFNNRECPLLKGKPKFFIIQVLILE